MIKRPALTSGAASSAGHSERVPNVRGANSAARRPLVVTSQYGGKGPPGPPSAPSDLEDDRAKLVENERWKYLATWLNTMAAGTIVVGILTPVFRVLSEGVDKAPPIDVLTIGGYFCIVLALAVVFHVGALGALGNLRP